MAELAGRSRLIVEALRVSDALRRQRAGLTYADLRELLGCTYRTALRWADAAEAAGVAERWTTEDGRTLLRWRGRRARR